VGWGMFNEFQLKMLNKEASSAKNKPSNIIEHLHLKKGMVVGDIGSGGGYFACEFSRKVGVEGHVYAVDLNRKSLEYIARNLEKKEIRNVKTVLAQPQEVELPEQFDLFFLRNVFHHLTEPEEYFKSLKRFLKDDGRIAIIDYEKRKFSFTGLFGHYTPLTVLLDIMERAGFYPFKQHDFLQDQLFIIFAKKGD
jgi:ubiquinone/menaquinone biosynthesis C-methylase UbiE